MSFMVSRERPLGDFISIYLARSRDEEIRSKKMVGGGAITSILIYLIEEGIVDGVVVARKKKGLEGEIVVARTREQIIRVSGSKWSVLPFTAKLRESLSEEELENVAIVSLPCQAQFLRQMKLYPLLETDFSRKIRIIISLFCMGTYATEAFVNFLEKVYGMDAETISDIHLKGENIHIITTEGEKTIPTSQILPYMQLGCLICPDYTGIFSDISAGVSENHPGYTILISRNKNSEEIIKNAQEKGYIEIMKGAPALQEEIELRAQAKLMRAVKYASIVL